MHKVPSHLKNLSLIFRIMRLVIIMLVFIFKLTVHSENSIFARKLSKRSKTFNMG